MRHKAVLISLILAAITLSIPACAQYFNRVHSATTVGVSPRALGMGDAFVGVTQDEQSLYWNPAGLAANRGASWAVLQGNGRVNNIDVVDDLAEAYDIISEDEYDFISQQDFDRLVDIARRSAGTPVEAEAGFMSAFAWDNIAIGAYSQAAGTAQFRVRNVAAGSAGPAAHPGQPSPGQTPAGGQVDVDGRAAGQVSAALGAGWDLSEQLSAGIALRKVSYHESRINKTFRPESTVSVLVDDSDDDDATTADVGLMYRPEPRVTFGAVVRNVTSPQFQLDLGGELGLIDREIDPSVHFGIGAVSENGDTTIGMDIHNVTGANDTSATLHYGVEHAIDRHFLVRAGYAGDIFTWGLTGRFGSLVLEMASSDDWDDMFGAGFTVNF